MADLYRTLTDAERKRIAPRTRFRGPRSFYRNTPEKMATWHKIRAIKNRRYRLNHGASNPRFRMPAPKWRNSPVYNLPPLRRGAGKV